MSVVALIINLIQQSIYFYKNSKVNKSTQKIPQLNT